LGDVLKGGLPKIALLYILTVGLISALLAAPQPGLTQKEVAAMQWVAANTSLDSSFALVTGDASDDITSEWFPAIAQRASLATAQGFEWRGEVFNQLVTDHTALQLCSTQTTECLERWSGTTHNTIQYIYLVVSPTSSYSTAALMNSLNSDPQYAQVYSSPEVQIFKAKNVTRSN
jgi:hypothetical protein